MVWNEIRGIKENVSWYEVVWFSHCLPKHAYILCLTIQERITTQDKLQSGTMKRRFFVLYVSIILTPSLTFSLPATPF